mgnify:CR=1 FL=1
MSLPRLCTRVARLEELRARAASPSGLVIVWMAAGDTRASALLAAGLTLADVAGRVVIFVQYEDLRSNAP